jgi:hypothetical protein
MYYWDGQQWVSTLSHDGRTRWNGSAWVPASQLSEPPTYQQIPPATRESTSWTRPLQYAVAVWGAISALYSLSLPFWMGGSVTQAMNQSMQQQQSLNSRVSPPPAEVTNMVASIMNVTLYIAAVVALVFCVVVIIGALQRWTWMYYVVLVWLGLGTIQAPFNLISVATGSSGVSGVSVPSWIYWVGAIVSIPTAALFVWMLVALVKRGPWAMRKAIR